MYEVGQTYRVSCIRKQFHVYIGSIDLQHQYKDVELSVPVYEHSHSDKENYQPHNHYHANYQFIDLTEDIWLKCRIDYHRITDVGQMIEYHDLICINPANRSVLHYSTPVEMIARVTLASDSIINVCKDGQIKKICPHTGYDLTEVKAVDGIIRCPMHQLCFDEKTEKIINFERNK